MRPVALALLLSMNAFASSDTVEIDLQIIIGGNFSVDHLGPEWYRAVVARVQAQPDRYLDALERRILPRVDEEGLASLYLGNLLRLVHDERAERVRWIAADLRERTVDALLRVARKNPRGRAAQEEHERELFRLQARFAEYSELAR
jgi:hypothetical protein